MSAWLEALRREAARTSQAQVARRIGYSAGLVNQVLKGTYKADLRGVRQAVEGVLLAATVECPVLGPIGANKCLQFQRQPLAATTPERVALYRACRSGCPHSSLVTGKEERDEVLP